MMVVLSLQGTVQTQDQVSQDQVWWLGRGTLVEVSLQAGNPQHHLSLGQNYQKHSNPEAKGVAV